MQFGRVLADWKEVFSTQKIESVSVITAYNPFSQQDDQEDNEARQSHLYDRLADEGFEVLKGVGTSQDKQWQEPSFFVFDMPKAELVKYLASFEQTGGVWMGSDAIPELILHPSLELT